MKLKHGFTLVEMLAVIVIISIITVLAIPAIASANRKTKEKLRDTKITYAEQALLSWSQDNENCFISGGAIDCVTGLSKGCSSNNNMLTCHVSYGDLVEYNLIKHDKIIDGTKTVIDPVTNNSMNDNDVIIIYDKIKRTFKIENED